MGMIMIKGGITENTKKNYNFGHFDPQVLRGLLGLTMEITI